MRPNQEKYEFLKWLEQPVDKRKPQSVKEYARIHNLVYPTLLFWTKQKAESDAHDKDPEAQRQNVIRSLYDKAVTRDGDRSGKNAELWLDQMGFTPKKKEEVTHKFDLSADEHERVRTEANRRVQELTGNTNGVGGLLPQSSVLLDEVRPDNKQEHGEAGQVGAMAVSP